VPEGHTIHRIARDHRKFFSGERIAFSSPQGRFIEGAKTIHRRPLQNVDAYGKHLFYEFSSRRYLHIHLGLYGKFNTRRLPLPAPRGAIRLRAIGERHGFDLRGPNQCELIDGKQYRAITDRLGPDPLRDDADRNRAWERISKSRTPIGGLLLNQAVISGIGNVYRAELLFETKIDPHRKGCDITQPEFEQLWKLMLRWLPLGVRTNRIITADAKQLGKTPTTLLQNERLLIYKKNNCLDCGASVIRAALANRTIYYCKRCQH